MKKEQAYQALGLNTNATEADVKKSFKNLAKSKHPDLNKDPNASEEFKKINEAYQAITNNKFDDDIPTFHHHQANGFDINDLLNNFININQRQQTNFKTFDAPDINVEITLSFKESVLGVTKPINYTNSVACPTCEGTTEEVDKNACKICNGIGFSVKKQGFTTIQTGCQNCKGKRSTKLCTSCSGKGTFIHKQNHMVNVPAGVKNRCKTCCKKCW